MAQKHRSIKTKLQPKSKPQPTTCTTPQYFIIDTVLPSHVVNDCSIFTTYTPSKRVHRTAFGTEITIEGIGNIEVRVLAGRKSIIFTIHNCWHVLSLPHHFLSSLSVTSPSHGNHVMLSGRTPRLLFPQKDRLTKPNLPKYTPFTREGGFFVLKFDIPTQVSLPPQCKPTTSHSVVWTLAVLTPSHSLQALSSLHCPFASLSLAVPSLPHFPSSQSPLSNLQFDNSGFLSLQIWLLYQHYVL